MKFLVDAQLPLRLARRLNEAGHDAIHTLDLPEGNRTPDSEINRISILEQRVVVTKDVDFVSPFLFMQGLSSYCLFLLVTSTTKVLRTSLFHA
jgi:predicted nuclease of predicted toxin-antitoxin system